MATAKSYPPDPGGVRCTVTLSVHSTQNQAHGRINEFMNHLPAMTHQDAGKRMLSVRPPNFNRIATPMSAGNVKNGNILLKDAMKKYVEAIGPSLSGTTVQGIFKRTI